MATLRFGGHFLFERFTAVGCFTGVPWDEALVSSKETLRWQEDLIENHSVYSSAKGEIPKETKLRTAIVM